MGKLEESITPVQTLECSWKRVRTGKHLLNSKVSEALRTATSSQ